MGKLLPLSHFPFLSRRRSEMSKFANTQISHVCPLYGRFHSFAEAYKLLFQSLGDKSTDNIKWYWFTHPKQNRSLLIFVWNVPGQLIWSEMSKFARLCDLIIPAITIILHLNSCANVFLFLPYTSDII